MKFSAQMVELIVQLVKSCLPVCIGLCVCLCVNQGGTNHTLEICSCMRIGTFRRTFTADTFYREFRLNILFPENSPGVCPSQFASRPAELHSARLSPLNVSYWLHVNHIISYHIIKTFLVRLLLKGHRCITIVSLQRHLSYRVQPAGG